MDSARGRYVLSQCDSSRVTPVFLTQSCLLSPPLTWNESDTKPGPGSTSRSLRSFLVGEVWPRGELTFSRVGMVDGKVALCSPAYSVPGRRAAGIRGRRQWTPADVVQEIVYSAHAYFMKPMVFNESLSPVLVTGKHHPSGSNFHIKRRIA